MRAEIIGQVEVEIFGVLMNLRGGIGNKIYFVKRESSLQTKHDRLLKRKVLSAKRIKGVYSKQQTKYIWSQDLRKRKQKNCRKATLGTKKNDMDKILSTQSNISIILSLHPEYLTKNEKRRCNCKDILIHPRGSPLLSWYNQHFFTRVERYLFIPSHYGDFEK